MASTTAPPAAPPPGAAGGAPVDGLSPVERRAIAAWTLSVAGGRDGEQPFIPAAVRELPPDVRLACALDPQRSAAWQERERRRVVASPIYLTRWYGHLQPPTGPPIPFEFWPLVDRAAELAIGARTQEDVLRILWAEKRVLMLKARQIGMTWLVLHYAYWLLAFHVDTPRARVLALSKHGKDAAKLLERARRIRELLPPFLRHDEHPDTRGSKSELELDGRGKIVSLAGDPDAARSETASLVLVDEGAFVRNQGYGDTITAVEATVGDDGQIFKLSTGNGQSGDGAAFADEVVRAVDGDLDDAFVFLPDQTDPRRSDEWREKARRRYPSDEEFRQEHPENVEEALGGEHSIKVYPTAHIRAARMIGQALDQLDGGRWLDQTARDEGLEWGIDWGDFQTFAIWAVGLPAGGARALPGLMLTDELVQTLVDPEEASLCVLDHVHRYLHHDDPRFVGSRADSAPPGNNRIFEKRLTRRRELDDPGRWPDQHVSVPFGVYKQGGQGKRGVNTVAFVQALLKASHDLVQLDGWDDPARLREVRGVLAVSPRCKLWLAQARNLEKDPKDGKVRKPDMDPRRPEHGDHGPDAVVALAYRRAERWTIQATEERKNDGDDRRSDREGRRAPHPADW